MGLDSVSKPALETAKQWKKNIQEELSGVGAGVAKKKAVEISDLPSGDLLRLGKLGPNAKADISGFGCKRNIEPLPTYVRAKCEKVISGRNNSYIVLGRDRPKSKLSGYGGKGHTKSGMIDLVVGRLGSNTSYKDVRAHPDFREDSARIYISQRTDIDHNFELVGSPGAPRAINYKDEPIPRASIGIKADTVRIIGREGIRLVTEQGTDNSMGGLIQSRFGIDLVAGNDDSDIQPMVRGRNLVKALVAIVTELDELREVFNGFVDIQHKYNTKIQNHTHHSPLFGRPKTSESPTLLYAGMNCTMDVFSKTVVSCKLQAFNLQAFKKNFLSPGITMPSDNYICSRYNHVN